MKSIEDILFDKGLVARDDLDKARVAATSSFKPLPSVLVERGLISEPEMLAVLAEHHGMDLRQIADSKPDYTAIRAIPAKLAVHYSVVPLSLMGNVVTIAVSNPLDLAPVEDIETNLGLRVERVLASSGDIRNALARFYGVGADTVEKILSETGDRPATDDAEAAHDLAKHAEDASVVKLVNQLLHEAITDRATDIHFEMQRSGVVVRRRIDGVLYDTSVPKNISLLYPSIVSRIKLMSGLNIVEKRLPQDGRTRVKLGAGEYDLRISVVPAIHGEDVVIRILPASMLFDLSHIGFSEQHLSAIASLISRPHGIIFLSGPTGSGKTTTLYACLSRINSRDRKIITIEDPVEYELRGITQTQIRPAIGFTFASALRSMLRHDPDVMMVGEVRDKETAEIAVQTAMTGHLVLSTLHTNDAAGGAVRLADMGIEPYLVSSTVLAFIAQRLVRLICPFCKKSYEYEGRTVYRGSGCRKCGNRGYSGREAICEILLLEPAIQDLILAKASAGQIRNKADELGMQTLAHDGLSKIEKGITTVEEVTRVTMF